MLTLLGDLPWCIVLVAVGDAAGANWDTWHRRFGYLDYVVVAALVGARGLVATASRRQPGH